MAAKYFNCIMAAVYGTAQLLLFSRIGRYAGLAMKWNPLWNITILTDTFGARAKKQ